MFRILLLLAIFPLMSYASESSEDILQIDNSRKVEIRGAIRDLDKDAARLLSFARKEKAPIFIIIDSPGGSVMAGARFIQAMDRAKAAGSDIHCIVEGMAASMAMHIFGNCSVRYAFETSFLLWHPAFIYINGAPIGKEEADRISTQITLLVELFERRLIKALDIPLDVYYNYYYNEYFVSAWRLNKMSPKFMRLVDDVVGE